MQKEMIYLSINDFIKINLDISIASNRKDSEYEFNFTRWKTLIFSSTKLKFVLKYTQSVLQWLAKVVDVTNFSVSIDTTTVDRFNLSFYEFETHIFNSTLITNFYLIPEEDWSTKVYEQHYSKYDVMNGEITIRQESQFWKGENGFEKFVNLIYEVFKEPYKYNSVLPVQWQIEFKDKKLNNSQIRMQLDALNQAGIRPLDPYLTMEQAIEIESGKDVEEVLKKHEAETKKQKTINPIWDEAIAEENKFKQLNIDESMRLIHGLPPKNKK